MMKRRVMGTEKLESTLVLILIKYYKVNYVKNNERGSILNTHSE